MTHLLRKRAFQSLFTTNNKAKFLSVGTYKQVSVSCVQHLFKRSMGVLAFLFLAFALTACSKETGDTESVANNNNPTVENVVSAAPANNKPQTTVSASAIQVAALAQDKVVSSENEKAPLNNEPALKVADIENNSLSKDEVSLTLVEDEDVNKDGVRDELEMYWAQLNLKPEQLRASHQIARVFQAAVAVPKISREDALILSDKMNDAVACVFARYPDNASKDSPPVNMIEDIRRMTLNTKNRRLAYQEYIKAAGVYRVTIDETKCL